MSSLLSSSRFVINLCFIFVVCRIVNDDKSISRCLLDIKDTHLICFLLFVRESKSKFFLAFLQNSNLNMRYFLDYLSPCCSCLKVLVSYDQTILKGFPSKFS